ncbi:hypothetical protein [Vibrio gallaecicus]|uniref:DUF2721 domain-containing protein n=1 Tax=Vibrio gallaecicus TaxID=552386 RepID=A0ABV4NGN8_9VIBR
MEALYAPIKDGNYEAFFIMLIILIVLQLPNILGVIGAYKKRRINELNQILLNEHLANKLKRHLQDEVQTESFKIAHGVTVSSPMLEATLTLKERVSKELAFRHVLNCVRLQPAIDGIESLGYRVQLRLFDYVYGAYNLFGGIVLLTTGVAAGMSFLIGLSETFQGSLLIISLLALSGGAYSFREGSLLVSVYHVNRALERFEKLSL